MLCVQYAYYYNTSFVNTPAAEMYSFKHKLQMKEMESFVIDAQLRE